MIENIKRYAPNAFIYTDLRSLFYYVVGFLNRYNIVDKSPRLADVRRRRCFVNEIVCYLPYLRQETV